MVAASLLTIALPALLAWTGVIPEPYELGADRIVIHAGMLHFPPLATELFLLVSSLSVVVTACLMTARVHDALAQAQQRLHIQAWQLRQMLPRAARAAAVADEPLAGAGEDARVVIGDRVAAELAEEGRVRHPDREAVEVAEHRRQVARRAHDAVRDAPREDRDVLVRDLAHEEVRDEVDALRAGRRSG